MKHYLQAINNHVDKNRQLSTSYSQDIHMQKPHKIDIIRHLSPLSTKLIITVIIKRIIYILTKRALKSFIKIQIKKMRIK